MTTFSGQISHGLYALGVVIDLLVLLGRFQINNIPVYGFHNIVTDPAAALQDVLIRNSDSMHDIKRLVILEFPQTMAGTPFSDLSQISLRSIFRSPLGKMSGKAVNDVDLSGRFMQINNDIGGKQSGL